MENREEEEINSERRKIDKNMSEGGNRNCVRKSKDSLISSSFFFPFFLPPPSHFYLGTVFLLDSLFTHHAALDNPCIFNSAASSKAVNLFISI